MTTDLIEAWSLEEGDQIVCQGNVYKIIEIFDGIDRDYAFHLVDEEGFRKTLEADGSTKFRLVLDNLVPID